MGLENAGRELEAYFGGKRGVGLVFASIRVGLLSVPVQNDSRLPPYILVEYSFFVQIRESV